MNKVLSEDPDSLNILIVFGTRPEMIKIAPIIWEYDHNLGFYKKKKKLSFYCLFTNQHKDLVSDGILNKLELSKYINFQLNLDMDMDMDKINRLSSITNSILRGISSILYDFDGFFHLILVQGDTTSAMACALATYYNKNKNKKKNIYLGHIEAGLRTFNILSPYPEEINRQIISKIADIQFAPSYFNKMNLLKNDNIAPKQIIITGNTVVDAIKYIYSDHANIFKNEFENYLQNSVEMHCLLPENNRNLLFGLFTMHRREKTMTKMYDILNAIYEILVTNGNLHFFYPIHPSQILVYEWIKKYKNENSSAIISRFHLIEPLSPTLMPFLYKYLSIIISDSGGIQEEITAFNNKSLNYFIPVLIIRDTTERVEIIESKQGILVGYNRPHDIIDNANKILSNITKYRNENKLNDYAPFGTGNASKIILESIYGNYLQFTGKSNKINKSMYNNYNYKNPIINSYYHKMKETKYIQQKTNELNGFLLLIFTIYKRNNIEKQLNYLLNSSIIPDYIVLFQNENHLHINITYLQEKYHNHFPNLYHFHSVNFNTKFFGRFLIPLYFNCDFWIIFDDDMSFLRKSISNYLRVVQEYNALATSNGRIITSLDPFKQRNVGNDNKLKPIDIQVDFGGHIWCGKTIWLRDAFSFEMPPYTIQTGEDMMLSAVLYTHYGIPTIVPKSCPNEEIKDWSHGGGDKYASWKQQNWTQYLDTRSIMAIYWIQKRNWLTLYQGIDRQQKILIDPQNNTLCN